ncbi:MAG: hypothetical protein ABSF97_01810 [Candidatus Sulfotelmatobacter sp.]
MRKRSPNHPKREATGEGELSHKNVETRCGQPESYGIRKLEISRPNATPGILAQELSSANSGCGCGCQGSSASTQYLNLLRVGPTGDSAEISLGQFSSAEAGCSCNWGGCGGGGGGGYSASATLPILMTNADQGVLASYSAGYSNSSTSSYYLATTSGASLASNSQVAMVPEQTYPVQPVLQRADGSYVGTVSSTVGNFMIAFTPSGGTLFTVPNDTPQIATAGGGVIGASGTTYDQNGNANGQLASLPTQSFTGNDYQLGSIDQVLDTPYNYTTSYAATAGGNPGPPQVYVPTLGAMYRAQIASDAKGYVGNSTNWNEKTNGGTVTCNLFVQSVLTQASNECQLNIPAPTRPNLSWWQSNWRHPFLAADWANPNVNGGCWKPLPAGPGGALPGDVIATGYPANGPDGTGHVGIVVEPNSGFPNYIDASSANVPPYWWTAQQKQSFIAGTITLTDYGFRAPGFDFTNPLDNQGLEQDSYVRRFSCY